MNLDYRCAGCGYSISNGNGCMGIASGVDDDAVSAASGFLDPVHELPLEIRLGVPERNLRETFLQPAENGFKSFGSVDSRFSLSK